MQQNSGIGNVLRWTALMGLLVLSAAVFAEDAVVQGFPLRNGDFVNYKSHGNPTDWYAITGMGSYTFSMEPLPTGMQNSASSVVITAATPGYGYWVQTVELPQGDYSLRADVYADNGTTARLATPGFNLDITGNGTWQTCSLDFIADGTTGIYLFSVNSMGTVKFRRVNAAIRQLSSAAVSCGDGTVLGSVVLPEAPDAAEEFAVYELQRYIGRMTGSVPGLAGRDSTAAGHRVLIGSAAPASYLAALAFLPEEAYIVGIEGSDVILAGRTARGTLYAVYDFLKMQGCRWYYPGAQGEVVPARQALSLPTASRTEVPDFAVRGFRANAGTFYLDGGWVNPNIEDYLDWAVRNRVNTLLFGYAQTASFGEHRGKEHLQTTNHAWAQFLLDDHPEWWVLVNGVRTKNSPSGMPNQLCVSNAQLRDYVTQTVMAYFAANPEARIYGLSANDYTYWCECSACRALDPDYGTGPWVKDASGFPALAMTDRTLNFINDIASRVAGVYPDKMIEVYAYAAGKVPPARESVHPNVLIKYCWHGAPLNRPITDLSYGYNAATAAELTGWKNAGAQHLGLYDYGNFFHPDSPNFWYYHQTDYLKTFKEQWGFEHVLSEANHTIAQSLPWYYLRTLSYWDRDRDYLAELRDFCEGFYGPAATDMYGYLVYMQQQELDSTIWRDDEENAPMQSLNFADFSLETLAEAKRYLDRAAIAVSADAALTYRVAMARFGHAVMTVEVGKQQASLDTVQKAQISKAFYLANDLSRTHMLLVQQPTVETLRSLWFLPYGFTWDRSGDWTANSNPDDDSKGRLVWRMQYAGRGSALGEATPWYAQTGQDMVWYSSYWKYALESAPRIYPGYMQIHLGRLNVPLVSWTNSTGEALTAAVAGTLSVMWGQLCDATDVEVALVQKKAGTGAFTELAAQRAVKPHGKVSYEETVTLTIDLPSIELASGDMLIISMRPITGTGSGLINLTDDLVIKTVSPRPVNCGAAGTVYLYGDISGSSGAPDCYVNLLDLTALADTWLRCTDPAEPQCN